MKTKQIPFIIGLGQKATQYRSLSKLKLGRPEIIAGFFLGCMIATMHAEKHKVKTLILCSPTPDETLKNIKADTVIFLAGTKEKWVIQEIKRMRKTLKSTRNSTNLIPNTGHKMNKDYQKVLLGVLDKNIG